MVINKNKSVFFKGAYKVQFVSSKNEIGNMIEAGYSLKKVWEDLKKSGKFDGSYNTFRLHFNNLLTDKVKKKSNISSVNNEIDKGAIDSKSLKIEPTEHEPISVSTVKSRSFVNDPTRASTTDKKSIY